EAAAELDAAQQRPKLGRDGGCRCVHAAPPLPAPVAVAKWLASRAKRAGLVEDDRRADELGSFSVAREIMRPMSGTLMASASRARAQAASTRSAPKRFTRPSRAYT